jgi:hypothetical protein
MRSFFEHVDAIAGFASTVRVMAGFMDQARIDSTG